MSATTEDAGSADAVAPDLGTESSLPVPEHEGDHDGDGTRGRLSVHRAASWWDALGRGQKVALVVLALIVGLNLVLASLKMITGGEPGGPVSSSFSTGGTGLEGYADLLREAGHPVTRLRSKTATSNLPTDATVVVADPQKLTQSEGLALLRFVQGGGRLVVTGRAGATLVAAATGTSIEHHGMERSDRVPVWVPTHDTGAARELAGDRGGRWVDVGRLLPLAGDDQGPSIVAADVGEGHLVAVADTAMLQNSQLGQADNAALGLALAGSPKRPVIFVESVHGYAAAGLKSVPSSWKWAALGLAVALAIGLWSFGTRFGPPEPQQRDFPPPRRDHVEAVAAALDQAGADTVALDHDSPGAPP